MKRVTNIVRNAAQHWVGDGFPVRSIFSYHSGATFSPFLLLDYAGPTEFGPAETPRGVGPHPHRGFETVTIVYQGEVAHRDSAGNTGKIGPGDVQWMTAASGVVHEELHSRDFTRNGGTLEMIQLWVNLPAKDKMSPPRYQDLLDRAIPSIALPEGAGSLRVIAGDFEGTKGPAKTHTAVDLWDIQLAAGRSTRLSVPKGHTSLLLVRSGTVRIDGDATVGAMELATLSPTGESFAIETTDQDAHLVMLAGAPIPEPVVGYGPFVMNTRAEIGKAIEDFESGRMGRLD